MSMVGKKIARWRQTRRLSERQAAEVIGVSQPTLRAVERGEVRRIGLDIAQAFVRACGGAVTLEDFLAKPHRRRAA